MHFKYLFLFIACTTIIISMELPQKQTYLPELPKDVLQIIAWNVMQDSPSSLASLACVNKAMNSFVKKFIDKNERDFLALRDQEKKNFHCAFRALINYCSIAPYLKPPINLNKINKDLSDKTLLMSATAQPNFKAVKELLAAGANPNSQNDFGWTALMYAAANAIFTSISIPMLALLIQAGAG